MFTIRQIIHLCGGPAQISERSGKTDNPVGAEAVKHWEKEGGTIRDVHWGLLIEILGEKGIPLTAEDLFEANQQARQARAPEETPEDIAGLARVGT